MNLKRLWTMVLLKEILSRLSERIKIHDYVLDGERVEPHEKLSLEKVSDIIKKLGEDN